MGKAPSASRADTAVKLVLIFFISLLSFSVGTYVGKQVSESEARQAALEVDYNSVAEQHDGQTDEHATAQNEEASHDATAPMSDEEASSLAEEFVQAERKTASAATAAHGETNAHGETSAHGETVSPTENTESAVSVSKEAGYTHRSKMKANNHEEVAEIKRNAAADEPKKTEVSSAANRVSHDLAPAADSKKPTPAPSALPTVATTAIGKYTVQVASYATEEEAKSHALKLTTKGYSAFYVPATISDKTWYRVSVGLFSDQKSATNYRTELLATQVVSSAIVQKIVK